MDYIDHMFSKLVAPDTISNVAIVVMSLYPGFTVFTSKLSRIGLFENIREARRNDII